MVGPFQVLALGKVVDDVVVLRGKVGFLRRGQLALRVVYYGRGIWTRLALYAPRGVLSNRSDFVQRVREVLLRRVARYFPEGSLVRPARGVLASTLDDGPAVPGFGVFGVQRGGDSPTQDGGLQGLVGLVDNEQGEFLDSVGVLEQFGQAQVGYVVEFVWFLRVIVGYMGE